jgi:hypothetical protein
MSARSNPPSLQGLLVCAAFWVVVLSLTCCHKAHTAEYTPSRPAYWDVDLGPQSGTPLAASVQPSAAPAQPPASTPWIPLGGIGGTLLLLFAPRILRAAKPLLRLGGWLP